MWRNVPHNIYYAYCTSFPPNPNKTTARYADDVAFINRQATSELESLFYVDQSHFGIHGVYPTSLRLELSTVGLGRVLKLLDVEAFPASETSGPLLTKLYDKRKQPQFRGLVQVMRFPAADSMLAWSCKLNVFKCVQCPVGTILTHHHWIQSFKAEVVQLLVEMIKAGYPHVQLLYRCRRRCKITIVLFGITRGVGHNGNIHISGLYPRIKAAVYDASPGSG